MEAISKVIQKQAEPAGNLPLQVRNAGFQDFLKTFEFASFIHQFYVFVLDLHGKTGYFIYATGTFLPERSMNHAAQK